MQIGIYSYRWFVESCYLRFHGVCRSSHLFLTTEILNMGVEASSETWTTINQWMEYHVIEESIDILELQCLLHDKSN